MRFISPGAPSTLLFRSARATTMNWDGPPDAMPSELRSATLRTVSLARPLLTIRINVLLSRDQRHWN
ncbi:hypothetical protein ABTM14_20110, partial [Acinetobacter baumannii]